MSDKPMIFSAEMVRALLDGQKSQTRRRLKEQNSIADAVKIGGRYQWKSWKTGCTLGDVAAPYASGDRLWVRECWSGNHAFRETRPSQRSSFVGEGVPFFHDEVWYWADGSPEYGDWERPRPSIHMPRWASRLTLLVTDVRVQRVQEINEADAQAEGSFLGRCACMPPQNQGDNINRMFRQTRCIKCGQEFRDLWKSLHGPDAWARNDWVAAISFTVHSCNIDQMDAP